MALPGGSGPAQSPFVDEFDEPGGRRAGYLPWHPCLNSWFFQGHGLFATQPSCHRLDLLGEGGIFVCSGLWLKEHQSVYKYILHVDLQLLTTPPRVSAACLLMCLSTCVQLIPTWGW